MRTALKEWAAVIEALARGEQLFLLRKGGIAEGKQGFEVKHHEFLFFPTWEHQHAGLVRPEYHALLDGLKPQRNDTLDLTYCGRVSDIVPAPRSVEQMRLLEPHHIWTNGFIEKRYQYRPDLPLYLVIVRLHRLPEPVSIPIDPRYAGCRSWVDIAEDVRVEPAHPVLPDARFEEARERLLTRLSDVEVA